MKQILLIAVLFLSLSCEAQDVIFDQEYYAQRARVSIFRQEKDSLFLYSHENTKNRDLSPRSKFKIIRDSIIDDTTKVFFLSSKKNTTTRISKLFIINYDRRKGYYFIRERRKKPEPRILFPESELKGIIPLRDLEKLKKEELWKEFFNTKKEDFEKIDFDSENYWTQYNNFFIKKGYNPFIE